MKRKLLFAMVALLSIVGVRQANAYTVSELTSAGWEEVTSLPTSSSELGKYYYVFWETQADLMLGEENGSGKDGDSQENKLTGVYRTPADPATDKTKVWILEYSATHFYGIRNLSNPHLLLQSREKATHRVQAEWEKIPSQWTQWGFTYADSKWSIQNKLPSNKGGGDNNWIGPWNTDAFQDNMVVAGNAGGNGNKKGLFKIYRKSRLSYDGTSYDYGTASASSPLVVTGLIANANFSHSTTGWNITGEGPNDFNTTYTAFEVYLRATGLSQEIADLPNGVYKVTMQAAVNLSGTFYLFATSSNGTTKTPATVAPGANFTTTAQSISENANYAKIETYAIVTDGHLTIGHNESRNSTWSVFDNYTLTYYGAESDAYALALSSEAAKANPVISALDASDLKTSLSSGHTSRSAEATLANIQWMTFVASAATELKDANKLYIAAKAIADKEYTETTSGSHATYETAINTYVTSVTNATEASTVTTAISTLKAAVKTYVNAAEPKNDGESFEITCLIANPSFSDNTITGWTREVSGGGNAQTNYGCNEFWNNTFNFYQDLAALPNGSYQLSVQAFSRPGGNDTAYPAYKSGTDNTTAELYVNSDASRVGNIYSYKDNTTGAKVTSGSYIDFKCEVDEGSDYWVPNGMEGASLYFADENVYKTEVAALVDDNTLRIGFRDESLTANQWTIFDNFRLYYYGSSKLVYYKQYLPQLKAEVTEDLANAAYDNVTGKERGDLETANAATPASETELAYKAVIDDIKEKQTAFKTAKTSYDALVAAKASSLTKFTNNIGTGVFQYNETTNNTLYSAYETQKAYVDAYTVTSSSTASAVQALVDAYDDAVDDYNNQPLNAPDTEKRYVLTIVEDGKDWNGNAVTFREGAANETEGNFGIKYQTTTNVNYNQAIKFTATSGNHYKLSVTSADGTEMYLTTQKKGYNKDDGGYGDERIRMTNDASKALEVEIRATSTDNQFQLYNSTAPGIIANSNNDDMYTANSCNFTIAEASQATVSILAKPGKYGTVIYPFTPDVSTGFDYITFYSCSSQDGETVVIEPVDKRDIEANIPYVIKNTGETDYSASPLSLTDWGTAAALSYTEGWLTGVYSEITIPENSYVLQTQGEGEGVQSFYKVTGTLTSTPNRAYLTLSAGAKVLRIVDGQASEVTAPEVVETEEEEILFNMAGIQVDKNFKGVVVNQKGVKRFNR